jgi:hypothetical protein
VHVMCESCARVCGVCEHDVHLFATADADSTARNGQRHGQESKTKPTTLGESSDIEDSDCAEVDEEVTQESDKEDKEVTQEADKEDIETDAIIAGHKVELIDGDGKTWAQTFVIDGEPVLPAEWHKSGQVGDYILVRGGMRQNADTGDGSKPMAVASRWNSVKLFKKPAKRKKIKDYLQYPGILQSDWAFFDRDITPADLMRHMEFLVDLQHVKAKTAPVKHVKSKACPEDTVD